MITTSKRLVAKALVAGTALAWGFAGLVSNAQAAATIVITNINAPGEGFNDATPAAPVGNNTGTTLGEQRLIAFTYAANVWGATLTSNVTINIQAQFSLPSVAPAQPRSFATLPARRRAGPGIPMHWRTSSRAPTSAATSRRSTPTSIRTWASRAA